MKYSQTALESAEVTKTLRSFFDKLGGETKHSDKSYSLLTFWVPVRLDELKNVYLLVVLQRAEDGSYGMMYGHKVKEDLKKDAIVPDISFFLSFTSIRRITSIEILYPNGYSSELQLSDAKPKELVISGEQWPGVRQVVHFASDGTFTTEENVL
jgi:hypothetical protein